MKFQAAATAATFTSPYQLLRSPLVIIFVVSISILSSSASYSFTLSSTNYYYYCPASSPQPLLRPRRLPSSPLPPYCKSPHPPHLLPRVHLFVPKMMA